MAGIKETKEQLRNELKELYQQWSGMRDILFSPDENPEAWKKYVEITAEFAKKTAVLAHLIFIEEPQKETEALPVVVPEIKTPEVIIPPLVPVMEKITPLTEEIKTPGIIPPVIPAIEKNSSSPVLQPVSKKLPDLKSMIGFNEKIMFIRSLFGGNHAAYENVIDRLNKSTDVTEADSILRELASAQSWVVDSEPSQIFHSIVKRRFA